MSYEIKKGKVQRIPWPKGMNQTEWLKLRADISGESNEEVVRLGASEVSVATGNNAFQSPKRLFHKLTGYHKLDVVNETLAGGNLLEPVICKRWEGFVLDDMETSLLNSLNGVRVNKIKKAEFFLLNDAYPYLSVSLDYIPQGVQYSPWTGEKYAPLTPHEMKSTVDGYRRTWGKEGIPPSYMDQVQTQMLVSQTKIAVFHVLVDGRYYEVQEIPFNPEYVKEMLPKVEDFVERAKKGKRLVRMMRELLESGETEESEMFVAYKAIYDEITPEDVGIQDNLDLAYELQPYTTKPSDQFKTATAQDQKHMESYLEQLSLIKHAEAEKIRLRSILVASAGAWQGIRGEGVRMVNRRANPETGKKAYFSIA